MRFQMFYCPYLDLFPSNNLLLLQVGKYHASEATEAHRMAEKAVKYIERALEADEHNYACHKWSGVIISWSSEFIGTRRKIERSFDVKEHFEVSMWSTEWCEWWEDVHDMCSTCCT